jgi:hypothetical protein
MKYFVLVAFLVVPVMCAQERAAIVHVRPHAVIARGRWKSTTGKQGDEVAFKQAVEIDCFQVEKTCMEATASVIGAEPDLLVEYYEVVRWDENGILAENTDATCMTNQLIINFQEQGVLAIDAPKRGAEGFKGACKILDHTQPYKLVGA